LGLAGSSAIITAALRAVCAFYEVSFPMPEFANMVLAVERDELNIPAGLQDRVAQTYNHPVFMDFERSHMEKFNYGIYELIDIPDEVNLYVAYRTDLAEGSEILHSRLRDDYNSGVPQVLEAIQEWSMLTDQMRDALIRQNYHLIPGLINRNFDLRCEVCRSCISEKNLRMVQLARSVGASAKFTGSGGAIIGSYENQEMFEELRRELNKFQVEVIKPQIVREQVLQA
jgi:glucuronokinase